MAHAVYARGRDHPGELRGARARMALRRRQLRQEHLAGDGESRRRQAHHRHRRKAARDRTRPRDRRAALELHRAEHLPLRVLDAQGLRQGHRLRQGRRTRRRLHHHARLLPPRARRRDRTSARELGAAGRRQGLRQVRDGRSREGPHRRLGPLGGLGRALRRLSGHPARDRLHHQLVAPDRRQRHRRRRELRRAGIQPDPQGDGARRHPRVRREGRKPSSGGST